MEPNLNFVSASFARPCVPLMVIMMMMIAMMMLSSVYYMVVAPGFSGYPP